MLFALVLLALSGLVVSQPGCSTPSTLPTYSNSHLPDPFTTNEGQSITNSSSWACRRAQIAALVQGYEIGTIPGRPPIVYGSLVQTNTTANLTVTAGLSQFQTVSFSSPIKYPTGTAPAGGWPLLITYGGSTLPVPSNVAVLTYNPDALGEETGPSSRGKGLFFNLTGSNYTAGAITAWTWGLSRIIDSLEQTPRANINTRKIAITGCSRFGKGVLYGGAFETRVALTIPQEAGVGGNACWRLTTYEKDQGNNVQPVPEIVTENVWFSKTFDGYVNTLDKLPYDHHELIALVAPRGLLAFESTNDTWSSPLSSWACANAGRTVFDALGALSSYGFVQDDHYPHCEFPEASAHVLNAFFDRFLNGNTNADTYYFSTDGEFNGTTWEAGDWITWNIPSFQS